MSVIFDYWRRVAQRASCDAAGFMGWSKTGVIRATARTAVLLIIAAVFGISVADWFGLHALQKTIPILLFAAIMYALAFMVFFVRAPWAMEQDLLAELRALRTELASHTDQMEAQSTEIAELRADLSGQLSLKRQIEEFFNEITRLETLAKQLELGGNAPVLRNNVTDGMDALVSRMQEFCNRHDAAEFLHHSRYVFDHLRVDLPAYEFDRMLPGILTKLHHVADEWERKFGDGVGPR